MCCLTQGRVLLPAEAPVTTIALMMAHTQYPLAGVSRTCHSSSMEVLHGQYTTRVLARYQVAGFDSQKMGALAKDLYERHGIGGAATGGLRLCPHVYNTIADIERAIRGVRELLA